MGVEADPLAVLPLTAASASAAFARATDPGREMTERQEQLRSLRSILASVRRQLDQSDQAVARLTTELGSIRYGADVLCRVGSVPALPGCAIEPFSRRRPQPAVSADGPAGSRPLRLRGAGHRRPAGRHRR